MTRFWVSWWSGNYADEGCTAPPRRFWVSGSRDRAGDDNRDELSLCAVIEAEDERAVEAYIRRYWPDYEMRFCESKPEGWQPPADRFQPHPGETG